MKNRRRKPLVSFDVKWSRKFWGQTREAVSTEFYSRHELEVSAGGYCSLHYHKFRANRFHVLAGQIEIIEMYGPHIVRTMLGPDNTYDIPSLVTHLFAVYKSGRIVEEYYPDRGGRVQNDDIVRIVEGGKIKVAELPNLPFNIIAAKGLGFAR